MNKPTNFDYRTGWSVTENVPAGSADAKAPYIDNGTARLDPSRYYSREFMEKEWERMWTRVWLLAGPVSDAPEPGDYFTFDIGRESFIIVRTNDNQLKAFYNTCPHRGNRVALEQFGSVDQFVCTFHSWRFNLDGKCALVTDPEMFRKEVLCHGTDLTEVRCEVAAGLVFINMDPDARPLADYLKPILGALEVYEIDKMYAVRHVRSEWAANWKVGVDAFYELYHLPTVHPETQGVMEYYYAQYDLYENGMSRMIVPFGRPSSRFPDQKTVNEGIRSMLRSAGLDPDSYKGDASEARTAIQKAKRERAKKLGLDYDRFTDAQLSDSFPYGVFPNVQLGCHPEGVFIMRFLPHPDDPNRFFYDTITMFRPVDDPSYTAPEWMGLPEGTDTSGRIRPEVEVFGVDERPDLGLVLNQDADLLPEVQKGVRSRGFRGALWSEQEVRIRHFHAELDRYINGEK
ncbi:MAG TPA: aromatic ring-hydroxylating dioxygenase subunit alpha [Sphingomonadales bacterium]